MTQMKLHVLVNDLVDFHAVVAAIRSVPEVTVVSELDRAGIVTVHTDPAIASAKRDELRALDHVEYVLGPLVVT